MAGAMRTLLVVADQTNRYGRDALAGIDEVARSERWRAVLVDHGGPPPGLIPDGIIGFLEHHQAWRAAARQHGTPTVVLDEDVLIDQAEVGAAAARHLRERGLERGATVTFVDTNPCFAPRLAGFAGTMGGPCPGYVLQDLPWERQLIAFGPWLRALPRPVGIFAPNDHLAGIVLKGCVELGLAVPGAVAVVGADDDLRLCLGAALPLSSVRMPHQAQGREGALRLRRLFAGEDAGPPAVVRPGSVCQRLSSDVLHCADEAVACALGWIRRCYAAPLGIDALAAEAGLNRRTLERRFRSVLGRSIHDELRRVRIAQAQELLTREADLPVAAVAAAVGLSASAFTSAFLAESGLSPGAWRSGALTER
jgi:LacI family transcriptional regulator